MKAATIAVGDKFVLYNKGGGRLVWEIVTFAPDVPGVNVMYVPEGSKRDADGKYSNAGFINNEVLQKYFAGGEAKKLI